jgi:hypothetical protein
MEPDFAQFDEKSQMYDIRIQTYPYFAGDKRWAALVTYPHLEAEGLRHVVMFGRDTHQDMIVVHSWAPIARFAVGESPTTGDEPVEATVRRFAPQDLMLAVAFIRSEIALAYGSLRSSRKLTADLGSSGA